MFTVIAIALVALIGFAAMRDNFTGRKDLAHLSDDEQANVMALQTRQDIRLVAYLLGAVLLMLGIIADRIQ